MKLIYMDESQLSKLDPKKTVAILPVGRCCNHGEWLPVGIDAFLAEKLAGEIEKRARWPKGIATIILPTQFLFNGYDGLALLTNALLGWGSSGIVFRHILIVNGSIGEDGSVTKIFYANAHIQKLLADNFDDSFRFDEPFRHGGAVELSMVSAIDRSKIKNKIGSNMPETQTTIGGIIISEIATGLMKEIERMMV